MLSPWIDVTIPLRESLVVWPGNPSFNIRKHRDVEDGSLTNDSIITMDVHTGTHVEGLLHIESNADGPSTWPVDALVMDVWVTSLVNYPFVGPELIPDLPSNFHGILFKTSNSERDLWDDPLFITDYCALNESAASKIAHSPNIRAVGIDYLSIQSLNNSIAVHKYLLESSVAIIEGLDLRRVKPGAYHMVCLPLLISEAEAAPCRVMLRAIATQEPEIIESAPIVRA